MMFFNHGRRSLLGRQPHEVLSPGDPVHDRWVLAKRISALEEAILARHERSEEYKEELKRLRKEFAKGLEAFEERLAEDHRWMLARIEKVRESYDILTRQAQDIGGNEHRQVILGLLQIGLEIGGIFDPTGACDAVAGIGAALDGDWFGVATSVMGLVPYFGDTPKVARVGKWIERIENAIDLAGKSKSLRTALKPVMAKLETLFEAALDVPCLPKSLRSKLKRAHAKVEGFCFVAGTPVLVSDGETGKPVDPDILIALAAVGTFGLQKQRKRRNRAPRNGPAMNNDNLDNPHDDDIVGDQPPLRPESKQTDHPQGNEDDRTGAVTTPPKTMSEPVGRVRRALSSWMPRIGMVLCLLAAFFFGGRALWNTVAGEPEAATHAFQNIEDIRVGDRVLADDPNVEVATETRVDPATWRKLVLLAELKWEDGTLDDVNVETLQPPEWIADHNAAVGATVPLPLDLAEMGLPPDLKAKVIAIEPCPPIKGGPGRVVLTAVNHLNADVVEMSVRDAHGRRETFRPTGLHRFYSVDRRGWFHAHELSDGERIGGHAGDLTVQGIKRIPGVHRVYNMTVEGEHVYYVSGLGVLAHNNGCKPGKSQLHGPGDLPDDAIVVRGGQNLPDNYAKGSGVAIDSSGKMSGASVNSARGASAGDLSKGIPNKQIGQTTVGNIRKAGGNVVPSPNPKNPNHATLSGITPKDASRLNRPTNINPSKKK